MNDTQINISNTRTTDTRTTDSSKKTYQTPTLEPLGPWTMPIDDCVSSPENC